MSDSPKTRLYVDHPLGQGTRVEVTREQAHYLANVMRLQVGDAVALFNGKDGEFRAEIAEVSKRHAALEVGAQTKPLHMPPDLWLLFAPIKKARTDFIVEKAAEMGAARICPVQTAFTNSERIRRDRLQAHAIEAAEQCGGTFVPPVDDLKRLDAVLETWPNDRHLIFCDEAAVGFSRPLSGLDDNQSWALLIGPEGGFSEPERERLLGLPQVTRLSLGPRILRADTASVVALTLFQSSLGDWR